MNYDFQAIEAKWHKYWQEHDTFHTDVWDFSKPKYYVNCKRSCPDRHQSAG